jgi:transposase-like protein
MGVTSPVEFRERAVQMVVDHLDGYRSLTAAVRGIARKLGCSPDSLRVW